jgi:hypothetical protein
MHLRFASLSSLHSISSLSSRTINACHAVLYLSCNSFILLWLSLICSLEQGLAPWCRVCLSLQMRSLDFIWKWVQIRSSDIRHWALRICLSISPSPGWQQTRTSAGSSEGRRRGWCSTGHGLLGTSSSCICSPLFCLGGGWGSADDSLGPAAARVVSVGGI